MLACLGAKEAQQHSHQFMLSARPGQQRVPPKAPPKSFLAPFIMVRRFTGSKLAEGGGLAMPVQLCARGVACVQGGAHPLSLELRREALGEEGTRVRLNLLLRLNVVLHHLLQAQVLHTHARGVGMHTRGWSAQGPKRHG